MARNALQPIIYQLQEGLRNNGLFDTTSLEGITDRLALPGFSGGFGPEVIVLVSLFAIGFFFIVDVLTSGYGRSLAVTSAELWEAYKDKITFSDAERASRSLEPIVEVLDALARAAKRWGDPEDKDAVQNRALS